MKGTIIVLEGLDGSGKQTQSMKLLSYLKQYTDQVKLFSYPDYESDSSALVRMYLKGELSTNLFEINAYAASSFYAVDRYASYLKYWKDYYESGGILLMDRYVSSNAIHQMIKLPVEQWDDFIHWLEDYEHQKLKLPYPDLTIFLDMSRTVAEKLLLSRYEGDQQKKDLHEKNSAYLQDCTRCATYMVKKNNWKMVSCCDGKTPRLAEEIFLNILKQVKEVVSFL